MKRTALIAAAAAMIGLGAVNPAAAAHGNNNGDDTAAALLTLAVGTMIALSDGPDYHVQTVHYRDRGHYRNRGHWRNDPRFQRYSRYDSKLERCLTRAYRHNNSPYKCWKKAEKRYYKHHRGHNR